MPGRSVLLLLAVAGLGLGALAGAAEAATLNVANNGQDSGTCGAAASPCRSISQAIANASAGDRIVVGPGRYGDLDGDGNFTSPGEEAAEVGSGCFCMIKVDKPLTIESRAGAGATVLDAGGALVNVVQILANGVVFGRAKKGFTLTGGGDNDGLRIQNATGVKVAGNVALSNAIAGFTIFGGSGHMLTGNLASGNGDAGFSLDDFGAGHILTGNLAIANASLGFTFGGTGHLLTGNMASANTMNGFNFSGTGHQLRGNVAAGNAVDGFLVTDTTGILLSANAIHGNGRRGIRLSNNGTATISGNNIYGNDPTGIWCGLLNGSGNAIVAENNFWGAATGPGADPADDVCNTGAGSSTTTAPLAPKEVKGKAKPLF